ncbi:MAG: transaldolase [Anaerolineae bacterium]
MPTMQDLAVLGQSVWIDYIRRSFIASGDLQALIDTGLRGLTSNPAIFEKAIAGSNDYDDELATLARAGKSVTDIYETLAITDIRRAADLFRPVYDRTDRLDGYVSLEADPGLADDTEGTIAEARRFWGMVDRPNAFIKVPATPAGIPAIRTLIGEGININVTLMFSLAHYEAVAEAYIAGVEDLAAAGGDLRRIASVASVFVSRLDSAVDPGLEEMGETALLGKAAVANCKIIYARSREVFSSPRWRKLAASGARLQRPLWGSTSGKNPAYSDVLYVDELIGRDTVNTVPLATLKAFLDHGVARSALETGLAKAREQLARLAAVGIDVDAVTEQLQRDGVAAFAKSFQDLLGAIEQRRRQFTA